MRSHQLPIAQDASALRESLSILCAALRDGIHALVSGRLDDFDQAVHVQSAEAEKARRILRSHSGGKLGPEVLDYIREAASLSRLFGSHLSKFAASLEMAKSLRRLIENEYPGTVHHATSNSLSLKV